MTPGSFFILLVGGMAVVAGAYQVFALVACFSHLMRGDRLARATQSFGVSILKPVRGQHAGFEEALRTHVEQTYPKFELLLGHRSASDSAIPEIERTIREHPHADVRRIPCPADAPNGKVGVLMGLGEEARYPIVIVNDADIAVPPGYIEAVTAPLADPSIGVVTCLYRAVGHSMPSRFEALGVASDFAPSALVAPFVGVSEFGFGSTLAFRRADLEAIGGFAALAPYLADDYQLGAKIHKLGRRNLISKVVVTTQLHGETWGSVWRHQLRWARTVRLSRGDGYMGLPVTFATFWALVSAFTGLWWVAGGLLAVRLMMAVTAGWWVMRSADVLKYFWVIPVRDLYGVAVWVVGLFGDKVEWGGENLSLDGEGRITGRL